MTQRLLVISPVRNEAAHLELVADAMARQTRPPDLWVLVDDGSTDGTAEILAEMAERIGFVQVIRAPQQPSTGAVKDRLAMAAAPRTFNLGLNSVDWRSFTHVAKLDGDIELPGDYFERLLAEFVRDPQLGVAGGIWAEPDPHGAGAGAGASDSAGDGEDWKAQPIPLEHHVMGSLKCYSLACFEAIGGMQERLGWDTIDVTYARMRGFRTRSFPQLVARHHRPWGSADGALRGRARHGQCAYIVHYPLSWVTLRAFKMARLRPRGISGVSFLYGYLRSAVQRVERVEDREFRGFMRRELRARARRELTGRAGRGRGGLVPVSNSGR
jgi:poly-beta-1,6-N-acetyl-D-glucosamine synthase